MNRKKPETLSNRNYSLIGFTVFILYMVQLIPVTLYAGSDQSTSQIVDSLYVRATSGDTKYRDMVEQSKQALIDMGYKAVPQMLTKLDTRAAREMHAIVDIFKGIGEPAIDSLITRINSRNVFIRRLAIRCLGEIENDKAVAPLIAIKDHPDFRTRSGVMTALGKIGSQKGSIAVMQGLADQDDLVATAAAVACGKIKNGINVNMLITALNHPYYGVRYSAANSLVEIGDISAKSVIKSLQSGPQVLSIGYMIEILGKLGSSEALTIFESMITSVDWSIRASTAEALGNIQHKKSKNILRQAAKTETHPLVIHKIKQSLEKLQTN